MSATVPLTPLLTLLTDFGLSEPFVGVMKGVIQGRCPGARVIDLSHAIRRHDVREAAFWLSRCFGWFPEGSVHIAVVDPGVGTQRKALVARAAGHIFVAPDNGLLSYVLDGEGAEVRAVAIERLALPPLSRTFHGRDVFAPVGALLASQALDFQSVGPVVAPVLLPRPLPSKAGACHGSVVTIDHFGNLITDLELSSISAFREPKIEVRGQKCDLYDSYASVPVGRLLAVPGSFGTLEVAVREGSAEQLLGAERGDTVSVSDVAGRV